MARPRSEQINLNATPFYHCYTRCVRRSYLCGNDPLTGVDFGHRRDWIVARLKQLTSIFAIQICAYAIMNNHYHLVLYVNLAQGQQWTNDEVFNRWKNLFPTDAKRWSTADDAELIGRIAVWRERLMNVSWFMRCLNEFIACLANKEDECTGSFWEGRFKSQALLDEGAILTAMAYVDLNPIHANIAETPETSDFTSIQERIAFLKKQKIQTQSQINNSIQPPQLMPFNNSCPSMPSINFELADYLLLIDETGRISREDKAGMIPEICVPILTRLKLNSSSWLQMIYGFETDFSDAVGEERMLFSFKKKYYAKFKGGKAAKNYYLSVA